MLVAGSTFAAGYSPGRSSACTPTANSRCRNFLIDGAAAPSKAYGFDSRLPPEWRLRDRHAEFGELAPPPGTATSPAAASGNAAGTAETAHFAPGQSTGTGQRIIIWTAITAPIGAYVLSPLLDHRLANDDHGIWKRSNQLDLEYAVGLTELGGALWLGGKNRLGRTFWKSIDSSLYTAISVQAMKYAFSRARPYQSNDPKKWFQGSCCQSFPSGEVSFQASFVTPFIAEYYKQDPWIWALEALPAYDAMARMKVQGHWQTDVLAGWAIGTAWGLYAHFEPKPLVLSIMPDGIAIGLHASF